jgi:hypothetical protein
MPRTRRVLKDPVLESMRDGYELPAFLENHPDIQRVWFVALDRARTLYQPFYDDEDDVPDDLLMQSLVPALRLNGVLRSEIASRTNLVWQENEENWDRLYMAMAGCVLQAQIDAQAVGTWPEESV